MRKHFPKTTTGAAIADGKQLIARPDIEPDAVQFVPTDQMDQSRITTAFDMKERFIGTHSPAKFRVYAQCSLAEKKAAQLYRIGFTMGRLPANAGIHNPMIVRFSDKMLDDMGGENAVLRGVKCTVHLNQIVFWQKKEIIPLKQGLVENFAYGGHSGEL